MFDDYSIPIKIEKKTSNFILNETSKQSNITRSAEVTKEEEVQEESCKEEASTQITESLFLNSNEGEQRFNSFLSKASTLLFKVLNEKDDQENKEIDVFSNSSAITSIETRTLLLSALLENTDKKKTKKANKDISNIEDKDKNSSVEFSISDVALNKTTLMFSLYKDEHILPCSHFSHLYLCTYTQLNNSKKAQLHISIKKKAELDSCVSTVISLNHKISSHSNTSQDNIEAYLVGTYLGEILLYYYNTKTDKLSFQTCISSNFLHKERIVSIKFFDSLNQYLSVSGDGVVYTWELNQLTMEELFEESFLLEATSQTASKSNNQDKRNICLISSGFNLKFKNNKLKSVLQINPHCIELYQSSETALSNLNKSTPAKAFALVGCLDGSIYRIKLDFSTAAYNKSVINNSNNDSKSKSKTLYDQEVMNIFSHLKQEDVTEIRRTVEKFTETGLSNVGSSKEVTLRDLSKYNVDFTKYMRSLIEFNYEKCFSSVSSLSMGGQGFQSGGVFICTSSDGSFRIYDKQGKYLKIKYLEKEEKFSVAVFSLVTPGMIIAGTSLGTLQFYYYDYENNSLKVLSVQERSNKSSIRKILEKEGENDCVVLYLISENSMMEVIEVKVIRN
mmetsp:Transcript_2902/g.2978  ORF Transcript_2902/g.2978 Transcript_2902/m.2978 type:complete len:619 (-) Transcript_2902:21-1877(-)